MNSKQVINTFACGMIVVGVIFSVLSFLYHFLVDYGWMTTFVGGLLVFVAGSIVDRCTRGKGE